MSPQRRTVLYLGTYERDYPRNALVVEALRRAGYDVREIHAPVWERHRDKTAGLRSPATWLRLGLSLVVAYGSLLARAAPAGRGADAVVIGYIGQLDMLALAPLVKLLRRPVLFNPLVTLTDTLVEDRALVRPGGLPARVVEAVDRASLALADAVMVDTPENGRFLVERLGVPPGRIYHLDVGADDRVFAPPPGGQVPAEAGPLRVLFYGKFTPLHGVDTVLRAAALLDSSAFAFTLIGTGQTGEAARQLATELGLSHVEFVDWVPYDELPARIAAAGVVLGIFGGTGKAARVVPNKVYQAMAMGSAVVTADTPAVRRVLQDGRSALLVPPADPGALAAALVRLGDPERRAALGAGARVVFDEFGSINALARRVGEIVPAVCASPSRPELGWGRR